MKCELCKKEVVGIIRTHNVCSKHFDELKEDNSKRFRKGISITKSTKKLKQSPKDTKNGLKEDFGVKMKGGD